MGFWSLRSISPSSSSNHSVVVLLCGRGGKQWQCSSGFDCFSFVIRGWGSGWRQNPSIQILQLVRNNEPHLKRLLLLRRWLLQLLVMFYEPPRALSGEDYAHILTHTHTYTSFSGVVGSPCTDAPFFGEGLLGRVRNKWIPRKEYTAPAHCFGEFWSI